LDAIALARKDLGNAALPEVEAMQKTLDTLAQGVEGRGGMIIEADMAQWVKDLQKGINWNDPTGTLRNEALSKVQGIVNDALKAQNPAYKAAEGELADAINLKGKLADAMGLIRDPGKAWEAKDVAVAKLKGLLNPETRAATKKLLAQFAKVPGVPNFLESVKQTAAKASLSAPATGIHKLLGLGARLPEFGGFLAGVTPKIANTAASALSGGVQSIPALSNAIYQGLAQ
jgi:hypothetical protein